MSDIMETVKETESTRSKTNVVMMSPLEEERLRMKLRLQQTGEGGAANVNRTRGVRRMHSANYPGRALSLPTQGVQRNNSNLGLKNRLPERAGSFRSDMRPSAPSRSTDVASSMRGNAVARANSSLGLLRHKSSGAIRPRMPVTRGKSASGLRQFSRDQIVNSQFDQYINNISLNVSQGIGGRLQRQISDVSFSAITDDMSCISLDENGSLFTMDSIHLRKEQQLIAEPVDASTYIGDDCSFADHETFVTRLSTDDLDLFDANYGENSELMESPEQAVLTFAPNTLPFNGRLRRYDHHTDDEHSFCSRLTTDFTEFGEYEEEHSLRAE